MKYQKWLALLMSLVSCSSFANPQYKDTATTSSLTLFNQPGFFRFSFDNVKMPNNISDMGLVGFNYFADFTPNVYGGIGTYGSATGSQGGLFTLGVGAGVHAPLVANWWGDMGLHVGGGGGRASLVGGGLLVRPHVGIAYDFQWMRLGVHYSYIDFPDGDIRSHQIGLNLDFPYDFYYLRFHDAKSSLFSFKDISLFNHKNLAVYRNDFALLLQTYQQRSGTKNVAGDVQDGTISLVGAELDHYMSDSLFWSLKASGAFHGIPNGYMDILGGVGYHYNLGTSGIAFVPQFSAGLGGGGNVETGGGILIQPQLGIQVPLTTSFAARLSGGYLWAPQGELKAFTTTGQIIYHLDIATGSVQASTVPEFFSAQAWRIQLFNQTYVRPQRASTSRRTPDNMVVLQFDQFFTPNFFFSYQAASAYSGYRAGGFATGMIGPGVQTSPFFNNKMQVFGEFLIGAGGGGGLALGGGAIVEPVVGLHYAVTDAVGLQASVGQVKALHHDLDTPVINLGLSIRFATLNAENKRHGSF